MFRNDVLNLIKDVSRSKFANFLANFGFGSYQFEASQIRLSNRTLLILRLTQDVSSFSDSIVFFCLDQVAKPKSPKLYGLIHIFIFYYHCTFISTCLSTTIMAFKECRKKSSSPNGRAIKEKRTLF